MKHQQEAPVNLNDVNELKKSEPELMWRHVIFSGEFMQGKVILLDNQIMEGEPGYLVFTPLRLENTDKLVLVNRGWIDVGSSRDKVPAIETPSSVVKLEGVIKDVPSTGIFLGDIAVEKLDNGIYRAQRIHMDEIERLVKHEFLPYIIRLEPESGFGFERKWQLPGSGEEKHLGYAFQWFALAITLVVIYIAVNTRKI